MSHTKETTAFDESRDSALHEHTQAGDLSSINPTGVRRNKLTQQPRILHMADTADM